ncbi:tyrosine-type recombinase/integrase [Delftia sp. WSY_9]|uniref:tyrosine-type recombinase/integrase n=1 Tax=unclassified Delftia TaxID=2613839 RepID=UPI00370AE864
MRKTPRGRYELTIRSKLLPKPVYMTFDDQAEAQQYGHQVDQLLAAGVVPAGLVQQNASAPKPTERLRFVLIAWINTGQPAATDTPVLDLLVAELGKVLIADLTYKWAEAWVRSLKLERNFAPGTIRKRVGSLSRCLDWWLRQHPDVMVGNPLRLLPKGFATYTPKDRVDIEALNAAASEQAKPKVAKEDVQRERRLLPGELDRIERVLAGERRPDRERTIKLDDAPALRAMLLLILYTGLRLREAYTLRRGQFSLATRVIRAKASKQWHGKVKYREVPMRPELFGVMEVYLQALPDKGEQQLVFPWWNGVEDAQELTKVSSRLSNRFASLFAYSQCDGLTEHDLRHEATCLWFEMRTRTGGWMFREVEIHRIMGWASGSKMAQRYASFRAEDLAARMFN